MKAIKIGSRLGCLFSVALLLLIAPRGAQGQSEESESAIMDPDGMIEMTVEMAANGSEIDGFVSVENDYDEEYGYDCWYYFGDFGEFGCFVDFVGAQAYLWDNNSLVAFPQTISGGYAEVEVSATMHLGDSYELDGWAGADFISDYDYNGDYMTLGDLQLDMQVSNPQITSPSSITIPIGESDVPVTITGSGFGTSPTLNLPTGVSASGQNSSDTQITVTLSADDTATVGNSTFSVTANGTASNTEQLVLDGPYLMSVITDNSSHCDGCSTTIKRDIDYQIVNFSGSNAGPSTVCEQPNATSWSCQGNVPTQSGNVCNVNPHDSLDGTFMDEWTLRSDSYTPAPCGFQSLTDPWFWDMTLSPIGTPAGSLLTTVITVDNVTTPNQLPQGAIIPK